MLVIGHLALQPVAQQLREDEMREKLEVYNDEARLMCRRRMIASWNVATDVGNASKEMEKVSFLVVGTSFVREN